MQPLNPSPSSSSSSSTSYHTLTSLIAAIDIGSNTIMMTVAALNQEPTKGEVNKPQLNAQTTSNEAFQECVKWQQDNWDFYDFIRFASLGENMEQTGSISNTATKRAKGVLKEYRHQLDFFAKNYFTKTISSSIRLRVSATSAMREAKNQKAVKKELEKVIGCTIEVIDGVEEGRLTFLGSCAANHHYENIALIDIGGGSTEIILAASGAYKCSISLPIGAVRWLNRYNQQTLVSQSIALQAKKEVEAIFSEAFNKIPVEMQKQLSPCTFRAVAGVPTTLAAIKHNIPLRNFFLLENKPLTFLDIETIKNKLIATKTHDVTNNQTIWQAIDADRAPIMPISCIIFHTLLCSLQKKLGGKPQLTISVKGLRYGLLEEMKMST